MTKLVYIVALITLFSCKSKTPKTVASTSDKTKTEILKKKDSIAKVENSRFVKVEKKDVSLAKLNLSYNLGKRLLESCSTSKFKVFNSSEATQSVIESTTVEKVSTVCAKINSRNGKFKELSLLDITYDAENDSYLFRYNIEFEKKYFKRELFITINSEGKMASLKTKEIPKGPM